jgi:hypothetical protein
MCWASSGIARACLVLDFRRYTVEPPDLAGLKRQLPASATSVGVLPGMCRLGMGSAWFCHVQKVLMAYPLNLALG